MNQKLILICILCVGCGASDEPPKPPHVTSTDRVEIDPPANAAYGENQSMKSLTFRGHRYVLYRSAYSSYGYSTATAAMVHDPDCPCFKGWIAVEPQKRKR